MKLLLILSFICSFAFAEDFKFQSGDIILQSGKGGQADMIKVATNSKWTHVGVVINENGRMMVLEAVQPVRFVTVEDKGHHVELQILVLRFGVL